MKKSLYDKYKGEYINKISNLLESVDRIEREIGKIKSDFNDYPDKFYEFIIKLKYLSEIQRYFQLNDGAMGYGIFLIRYLLFDILVYLNILKDKTLNEDEKYTCALEIEVKFYFFLNCIYNFKEKFTKYFSYNQKHKTIEKSILNDCGQQNVLKLFDEFYKKIKDYCIARSYIVHDIYNIKYNDKKNEIYISCTNFDLSDDNLNGRIKNRYVISLDANKLAQLVENMQTIRKKVIELVYDIKNNINLEKLKFKFKDDKGYTIKG